MSSLDIAAWMSSAPRGAREGGLPERATVTLQSPAYPDSGHVFDVEGTHVIATFIVWPNGMVDATVLDVDTGRTVLQQHGTADGVDDLNRMFDAFLAVVVAVEGE